MDFFKFLVQNSCVIAYLNHPYWIFQTFTSANSVVMVYFSNYYELYRKPFTSTFAHYAHIYVRSSHIFSLFLFILLLVDSTALFVIRSG